MGAHVRTGRRLKQRRCVSRRAFEGIHLLSASGLGPLGLCGRGLWHTSTCVCVGVTFGSEKEECTATPAMCSRSCGARPEASSWKSLPGREEEVHDHTGRMQPHLGGGKVLPEDTDRRGYAISGGQMTQEHPPAQVPSSQAPSAGSWRPGKREKAAEGGGHSGP